MLDAQSTRFTDRNTALHVSTFTFWLISISLVNWARKRYAILFQTFMDSLAKKNRARLCLSSSKKKHRSLLSLHFELVTKTNLTLMRAVDYTRKSSIGKFFFAFGLFSLSRTYVFEDTATVGRDKKAIDSFRLHGLTDVFQSKLPVEITAKRERREIACLFPFGRFEFSSCLQVFSVETFALDIFREMRWRRGLVHSALRNCSMKTKWWSDHWAFVTISWRNNFFLVGVKTFSVFNLLSYENSTTADRDIRLSKHTVNFTPENCATTSMSFMCTGVVWGLCWLKNVWADGCISFEAEFIQK